MLDKNTNENQGGNLNRVLVVGKNSTIVKSIHKNLPRFNFISHKDLPKTDCLAYDKIFLFSWSSRSLTENLKILDCLPLNKVIFISSIAVLARVKRTQWASYPNAKLKCEKRVIQEGGKVIRVGIWDANLIKDLPDIVPVTTPKLLIDTMLESLRSEKIVFWPIEIRKGELSGIRAFLNRTLTSLSEKAPNINYLQALIAVTLKIFGFKNYSYTYDCLQFFSQRVLVGYGAVGSRVSNQLNKSRLNHSVVISREKDLFLNLRGFKGLRIGRYREGLSKFWHGVSVVQRGNEYYKKVPIFVSRQRAPSKTIFGQVIQIEFESPLPSIVIEHSEVIDARLFAYTIHLAAGVINNIKILQKTFSMKGIFSDQEVAEIGVVTTDELIKLGIITRFLNMVSGRRIIKGTFRSVDYMLDFRPNAPDTIKFDGENIYNNRLNQIIRKIISAKSLRLINQAIFNKFGISLDVDYFSVVIQIEVSSCIELDENGVLTRKRLQPDFVDGLLDHIAESFKSFHKRKNIETFDAIHVHGGFDISQLPKLGTLISEKRLFLHGNVLDGQRLGPFHNTVDMIKRECEITRNA